MWYKFCVSLEERIKELQNKNVSQHIIDYAMSLDQRSMGQAINEISKNPSITMDDLLEKTREQSKEQFFTKYEQEKAARFLSATIIFLQIQDN